ncbi:DUF2062 domain-containing protein [Thalassospiraceae bacterium LMO-JJ14]|nr:DUF2062 domain-containing protein [Thalassospiraceae bacterium LMO-JJ14]
MASVWPEMGWRRATRYLMYRIGRLPGSGYAIAGGFAWGAAMSFTPFIGLHIVMSAFGAWLSRCSIVAAVLGTIIGNPWTFPFIWIWLYKSGVAMGFGQRGVNAEAMDFSALFGSITEATLRGEWSFIAEHAMPVLTPMLASAIPTSVIVWVIFFLLLKPVIERYKSAALKRRAARAAELIDGLAGEQGEVA